MAAAPVVVRVLVVVAVGAVVDLQQWCGSPVDVWMLQQCCLVVVRMRVRNQVARTGLAARQLLLCRLVVVRMKVRNQVARAVHAARSHGWVVDGGDGKAGLCVWQTWWCDGWSVGYRVVASLV